MIQQNVSIVNNGIINHIPEQQSATKQVPSQEIKKNGLKDLQPSPKAKQSNPD